MNNMMLDTQFAFESWATRRLLETCLPLTQAQFEQPLGLGHGNLERTLSHLVGALTFFTDRLYRRSPRPRAGRDGKIYTPAELLALFDVADAELREAVTHTLAAHALTDRLSWTDTDLGPLDPRQQVTYAVALAQMLDHSNHHRTQAIDMLRLLGSDAPLEWHPFEWEEATRGRA